MTLYDLLEIPTNSSEKEIKAAYKKMAKKYHPDINKNGQDMFVRVNNAYSILSDPIQKVKYDMMINASTLKTFEIFTNNNNSNVRDFYSQSDLWHESFMKNNTPTKQWNFSNDNNFYQEETSFNNYKDLTIDGLGAFLDKDISLAFYQIYKNYKIDPNLEKRLLMKPEFLRNRITLNKLVDFLKYKYDYFAWIESKRYFDIEALLELTKEEIAKGLTVKMPLKTKAINEDRRFEIWHEELRNYAFNVPTNTQNGEITEFFNKGHKALGWQGDLILTIKIVPYIKTRLKIYSSTFSNDKTTLWFFVNNNKNENPNNHIFDYKTYEYKD